MVDETKEMEVEAVRLPFELDQVLNGFTVEDVYLVASTHAFEDIDVIVGDVLFPLSGVRIPLLVIICADFRKKIETVLDFEHLS